MKDGCFLLRQEPPLIVQLGRFGDELLLFPAFKLIREQMGVKPIVMVSHEYASVFDGISYATPWSVPLRWWQDSDKAKKLAKTRYNNVVVPQYWNDLSEPKETTPAKNGHIFFKAHGRMWLVEGESPDYGTAMWNRLGFTRKQMVTEPLVIDRRNRNREQQLVSRYMRNGKPTVLYNFTGYCSPFGYVPEMMRLFQDFQKKLNFVDLGKIRADRIYDLLGLYDLAKGLITIDTATAHLAPASRVPTLWLTVDGTGTSVPRGNVALHCKYSEAPKRLSEIRSVLDRWYGNTTSN